MIAKGTGLVKHWEETTYEQISPHMKMTKASVEYAFEGEIKGKALVEYLMFYRYYDPKDPHKSSATYVGLIAFTGQLSGKEGSFVLEDNGNFEDGTASSALKIISGSGFGALKDIGGTGKYRANQTGYHLELDYDFEGKK